MDTSPIGETDTIIITDQDVDMSLLNFTVTKNITLNCNSFESSLEYKSDSSADSQSEHSISNTNDQFDGIIYNISQSENKTVISFNSRPIFESLIKKLRSDFALPSDDILFTTHVQG